MIKDIIDKLDDKDRRLLLYALENDMTQFLELPDGRYVGVNTNCLRHLTVEENIGNWYYGEVKKP